MRALRKNEGGSFSLPLRFFPPTRDENTSGGRPTLAICLTLMRYLASSVLGAMILVQRATWVEEEKRRELRGRGRGRKKQRGG